MAKQLSASESTKIIGFSGDNVTHGNFRADEFLPELRGKRAIRKYREMRDNDSTIGAVMYGVEQILRDVELSVEPSDKDNEEAIEKAEFVTSVLEDMDHTLDDHISEALSFLSFGFAWFEVIYKRRNGPYAPDPKKRSKYSDGYMGIRKLATRAPWTISKFDVDEKTGDVLGIEQTGYGTNSNYIPIRKSIYYRTTAINGDPSGRSILRNAYTSYTYLNNLQSIEAIAVERELTGIPLARIPAEYLSSDATDGQTAVLNELKTVLRDVKFNEQGYVIIPSDTFMDKDGNPTDQKLVDIELISAQGTRNIDIDPVIKRYQHDIARSVLSEFLLLGSSSTGSYALSKSKTDLFLRALESYIQVIVDVLNEQLIKPLWLINGFDFEVMPKIVAGDVAPHDLQELGAYLRNLNGANIKLDTQVDIVDALLENAELPLLDREVYAQDLEDKKLVDQARADYYDDDDIPGNVGQQSDKEEEPDTSVGNNAGNED